MKIEFVGGAMSVTGSCYILKDDDFTIMIDCGMFQGKRELRDRNAIKLIYNPKVIDALLLTHAHIDHSGLIPKFVKDGFKGKVFATKATTDLCKIMLADSAHIQEMDIKWVNKKNRKLGREEENPLYTSEDADNAIEHFNPVHYGEIVDVRPGIKARFRDAGHILGSSIIELWIEKNGKKTKFVFSGDLGQKDQAIIRDPEIIDEADILFIESTYGDRLHKNKTDTYGEFAEIIKKAIDEKGNIIIPAFAIERTQEIIYSMGKLFKEGDIPKIPVYIDSPLAISATEIFRKNEQCFDEDTKKILMSGDSPLDFPNLTFTRTAKDSMRLNKEARGSIIISASGMCTAGRIKYHLQNNLYKKNSSILFVGYQAEGTLGRRIIEGAKQVRVYGEDIAVNAKIFTLGGFSAHADKNGLLEWISNIKTPDLKVFVVHGEENVSLNLSNEISTEFGHKTHVPRWGEIYDLKTSNFEVAPYGISETYTDIDIEIEKFTNTLNELVGKYKKAKEEKRMPNAEKLKQDINDTRELLAMLVDEI